MLTYVAAVCTKTMVSDGKCRDWPSHEKGMWSFLYTGVKKTIGKNLNLIAYYSYYCSWSGGVTFTFTFATTITVEQFRFVMVTGLTDSENKYDYYL